MVVKSKSYDGKVTLKNAFQDENGTVYPVGSANKKAMAGKSITPYDGTPVKKKYRISITEGIPGSVLRTDLNEAEEGTLVTITYDPEGGMRIDEITVTCEGENPEVTKVNDTTYTFLMPAYDVTVVGDTIGTEYLVKFDSDGGSAVKDQALPYGGKAVKPEDPVKEGYIFDGWYKVTGDTMADEPYDFDTEVTEEILLKAKWKTAEKPADDPSTTTPTQQPSGRSTGTPASGRTAVSAASVNARTGDSSQMLPWILLLIAGISSLAVLIFRKQRSRKTADK